MKIQFEWIDDDERLRHLCTQWRQQEAVALDTEFIRTRTFFPNIGLLQVADRHGIYLVDPLAIVDKQPLQAFLADQKVTKVIHSCSEDLDVFTRYLAVVPTPLFDTQIAAAFAGLGASISYARLVDAICGEVIPKQETRSNWLQRPLSQSQLDYAALDVVHLLDIYRQLKDRLQAKQRLVWVTADCDTIVQTKTRKDDFSQYYLKIKAAWKLNSQQLAVLQHLCIWREQKVRELNIPRSRLVKDSGLWDMACRLPQNKQQMLHIGELHPRFVAKYSQHCLQLIENVAEKQAVHLPVLPPPLNAEQVTLFKSLKSLVVDLAEHMEMPPELLARKQDIEFLVRNAHTGDSISLPYSLHNWRHGIVGRPLLNHLKSFMNTTAANKMCDIYRCAKKEGMYIYTEKGTSLDKLPEALKQRTGRLELAMSLMLTPEKKLAHARAEDVMTAIDNQGFYLQMPPAQANLESGHAINQVKPIQES